MTGRRVGALGAVLFLLVGGCGIQADGSPRAIDTDIEERTLPIDRSERVPAVEIATSIYLVTDAGRLRPTARQVRVSPRPPTHLASVLDALISGPTEAEAEEGLRSAVPSTTQVLAVTVDGDTAVVDLSEEFASIGGERELLAVGQLVLTVTTFPGVRQVRLQLSGRPTPLPLPDGSLTEGPVALSDYADLLDPDTAGGSDGD